MVTRSRSPLRCFITVACCLMPVALFAAGCGHSQAQDRGRGQAFYMQVTTTATGGAQSGPTTAGAGLPEIEASTVSPAGVTVVRLDNGLTVIVSENHNLPLVHVECSVHTGSTYEGKWLGAGLSHLLEHLVAEGAEAGGAEKHGSSAIDKIGGESNAFTNLDETSYFISAAASKTVDCIDLVAKWMTHPNITQADFEREHGVVQRELEMGEDSPERQLWEAHSRNIFGDHPAAVPIIGYKPPLAALTFKDVQEYHAKMYVPQNMVFAVVGDVDTAKVIQRVRQGFAGVQISRQPQHVLPDVAPITNTRRVQLDDASVTEVSEELGFQSISLHADDMYPLDVLSDILTNGETSRLVKSIRDEQGLVTRVSSSSWTPAWGKGQFAVDFRAAPDKADAAEKAILAQLRKVVEEGVKPEELAQAKRQKIAEYVYARQTLASQARMMLTDYQATQNVEFSKQYTDRIQKVTAEQVQAAAKKYFLFDKMAITRMSPAKEAATSGPTSQAATKLPKAEVFTLPNGLRVVLQPLPSADLASAVLVTRGGMLEETAQTNGLGMLMTSLATKGAGSLTADQIDSFFENAGGSIAGQLGTNTFYWQTTVLADSFAKALPIFADVVLKPTYPEEELKSYRPIALAAIKQNDESATGQLNKFFRKDFYGDSPMALQSLGSADVISKAAPAALKEYHDKFVNAGSSVLAVYGKFDPAEVKVAVEKLFADMPKGENKLPDLAAVKLPAAGQTVIHDTKLKGAGVLVAVPGMKVLDNQDTLPMSVLDTVISGYRYPSGWLHNELRGKQLVYSVHAYNAPALVPGAFIAYAQCEPAKVAEVTDIIRKDLRKTLTYQFTQEEVDQAVNIILTSDLLENESVSSLGMQAALDELYGFGYDYHSGKYEKLLRAVKPEDLTRVAKKYLAGGYSTTIVTPKPDLAAPAKEAK